MVFFVAYPDLKWLQKQPNLWKVFYVLRGVFLVKLLLKMPTYNVTMVGNPEKIVARYILICQLKIFIEKVRRVKHWHLYVVSLIFHFSDIT